jgi:hypothetical protein
MQSSEKPLSQIIDICRRKEGAFDFLNSQQRKVLGQIDICRTETAGIFVYRCENESCGHSEIQYKSCKNRACSVCSALPREKWKLQRENDLIPNTPYYHNVFTIPHSFSQIASQNQKVFQSLLLKTVEQTLKSFEEEYCKGGQIGFMLVLHTWSTRLLNHYHVHAAIPGGYILDDVWYPLNKYLFPARALATMFRKKLCSGIRSLYRKGKLKFYGDLAPLNDPGVFSEVIDKGYKKKWYVHSEVTKGNDPSRIMGYLANYVYKTAIDHSRIVTINENEVSFTYRSHEENDRGAWKSLALRPEEFLRRFSSHIQPSRFVRIRYYGIIGGGVKRRYLSLIFKQLKSEYEAINQKIHRSSCEDIKELSGRMTAYLCPCCRSKMLSPWEVYKRNAGLDPPGDCESLDSNEQVITKVCA